VVEFRVPKLAKQTKKKIEDIYKKMLGEPFTRCCIEGVGVGAKRKKKEDETI